MRLIKKLLRVIPDRLYLQIMYFYHFKCFVDFKNPKTFNEKIQWLKLYDRNPVYTTLVDKNLVKKYVSSIIGEQYIIPNYGAWKTAESIDFQQLPNQFVLKCNNDSGGIVICKDKLNFDEKKAIKVLKSRLKNNGFWYGREWPYKNVQPCIIAEKYMEDSLSKELNDYKIHCFNGRPEAILVCKDRFSTSGLTEDFFDIEWNHLNVKRPNIPNSNIKIERPQKLELMLDLARKLSKGIPFIRVDFYTVDDKVYFGELTLFPASGFAAFEPNEYDILLGNLLDI